jgi:hypothetical protein
VVSIQWNISLIRAAHDWKLDFFTLFFNLLYSFRFGQGGKDKLHLVPSKRGMFDVRYFYNFLVPHESNHFHGKSIWQHYPLESGFFTWIAFLRKILIMDNLRKWHVIVIDWCCMCKRGVETVDHLFLHYEIVSVVWRVVFSHLGLACVMPRRVTNFFFCLESVGR